MRLEPGYLDAAARLRYRPNGVARGLNRRRMDTIGVVAIIDGGEVNLYFLEVLNGILEGAAAQGQNVTVFSISDWHTDNKKIISFCDGRVDGMIFIAPTCFPASCADTILSHTPIVTLHASHNLHGAVNLGCRPMREARFWQLAISLNRDTAVSRILQAA